jgi:hypothetical protein
MVGEILRSFGMVVGYARELLADVPDGRMAESPLAGINHAAWIVGHLAHSFQAIGGELGLGAWLPDDWASRFGTGTRPAPDRSVYPSKIELLGWFDDGARRLTERLRRMSDADLNVPLPDERYRHVFPTLGAAVLHILTVHAAVHLGQLSAWRRAIGLPGVKDPL